MGDLGRDEARELLASSDDGTFNLLRDVFVPRHGIRFDPTEAELGCLRAASVGLGMKESGIVLGIGEETVKSHLTRARLKLRAKNTCHAVALAIRAGLI